MDTFFDSFFPSFIATVFGGIVLTFLLFWVREKFFQTVDISGRWYFMTTTVDSAYNPYKGMKLQYVAVIHREGNAIYGTTEKIYESSLEGEKEYIGKDRRRGTIKGSFEKFYLGKDKVSLHSIENEFSRKSTNFYELLIEDENNMKGYFTSMIADQTGEVTWQREQFFK